MTHKLPRRTIRDWSPDGPLTEAAWLERQREGGLVPDPLYGAGSAVVEVNGRRFRRYAMIEVVSQSAVETARPPVS